MTDDCYKLICNSTAVFLIFTAKAGEQSIEARYEVESCLAGAEVDDQTGSLLGRFPRPT